VSAESLSADARFGAVPLDAQLRLPAHVVYRTFAHETVVLNLQTGLYHGLDPVGGRMLEALEQEATVRGALRRLVADLDDADEAEVERDVLTLCADLLDRGLIERGPKGPSELS
jgi:hypothetical protein